MLPFPASAEVTTLVVLFCIPVAMPETFTAKLHAALAARVTPDRLTLPDPAAAAIVPPPQLPVNPLGVDTTRPAGNVSVKPIPLREVPALGFDSVKVNDVAAFKFTLAAPKAFAIVGGNLFGGGGGGGGPPYEPPPHAEAHQRPRSMTIQFGAERSSLGTFPCLRMSSSTANYSPLGTSFGQ